MSYWQSTSTMDMKPQPTYQSLVDRIALPFVFDDMVDEVCSAFGAKRELVFGKCKKTEEKFARWAIWKIMLSYGYSTTLCGKIVGQHDHSTVLWASERIDWDIENTEYVGRAWKKLKRYMKKSK